MLINIVEIFKINTFMADLLWKVSNTIIELWIVFYFFDFK